ncbi:MAG: YdcF family protein [Alphaproteobacteria bacterium]|jgi:uncharacterized SAM-binding protein YcdF (DUF218 family)|nr:YdcF family protein [Alphaproteobacteria bacterium]
MFFFLSKTVGLLAQPILHPLLLALLGLILGWLGWRTARRRLIISAFCLLLIYSWLPVAQLMIRPLENAYPAPAAQQIRQTSGIVVLGGFANSGLLPAERRAGQLGGAAERLVEAVGLAKIYPQKPVIFSGFSGALLPKGWDEARTTRYFLDRLGVEMAQIRLENRARNTAENARFSLMLAQPGDKDGWLLVTSAAHMPRAMASFAAAGWPEMTPYPVDYQSRPAGFDWAFNPAAGYAILHSALHEYLGLAAYWLSGRI